MSSIRFISSTTDCQFQVFVILDEDGFEPFLKKEKRFILVSLKNIFSIDTAIHPMMECPFISQSYSSHQFILSEIANLCTYIYIYFDLLTHLPSGLLVLLGFIEEEIFWMNIGRDLEVGRESDAEVESRRGRIRIEVGLIASGNQEVIEDKISRVGRNGIILFDFLGKNSRVYKTADENSVKLIQIRNCNPLLDVYRYLHPLTRVELKRTPETSKEIKKAVDELPENIFRIN